eukprot:2266606-Lingulodinium_polyedra.AAC.1
MRRLSYRSLALSEGERTGRPCQKPCSSRPRTGDGGPRIGRWRRMETVRQLGPARRRAMRPWDALAQRES